MVRPLPGCEKRFAQTQAPPSRSEAHAQGGQEVDRLQVGVVLALQDVVEDHAVLGAKAGLEDAAADGDLDIGVKGHEEPAHHIGEMTRRYRVESRRPSPSTLLAALRSLTASRSQ